MQKIILVIKKAALLTVFAVAVAFLYNIVNPRGIALIGDWEADQGVVTAKPKNDVVDRSLEINRIEVVKSLFEEGQTIFIDARSQSDYDDGHIKGAISMPLMSVEEKFDVFFEKVPVSAQIVTYCSGRTCTDSHELAQILMGFGYTHVRIFVDGYPGWLQAGLPIETSN